MQNPNINIPVEVTVLRDVKLSILDIQNKSNKEFEKKENVFLKEGTTLVVRQSALLDYQDLFKPTDKGLSIISFDYNELNAEHARQITNLHNDYKIKLEAKDFIIAKNNEAIALLQNRLQVFEEKEFENADKSSNIDQQSTEDIQSPQIDIPSSPSTKKKNSNQ